MNKQECIKAVADRAGVTQQCAESVIDAAGRPLGLLDITDLVSAGAPLPAIADDERSAAPTLTLHR